MDARKKPVTAADLQKLKDALKNSDGKDAESVLNSLESTCVNVEYFQYVRLRSNIMGHYLNQHRAHVRHDIWVTRVLENLANCNDAMVRCNYLIPKVMEQCPDASGLQNPCYRKFLNDQDIIDTFNKVVRTVNHNFLPTGSNERDLNRMISNTAEYVRESKDLPLFLAVVQNKELDEADHQRYLNDFIKPVEAALASYEDATTEAAKVAAYKLISEPLRNLSTEMYRRAALVYPQSYQPTWLRVAALPAAAPIAAIEAVQPEVRRLSL